MLAPIGHICFSRCKCIFPFKNPLYSLLFFALLHFCLLPFLFSMLPIPFFSSCSCFCSLAPCSFLKPFCVHCSKNTIYLPQVNLLLILLCKKKTDKYMFAEVYMTLIAGFNFFIVRLLLFTVYD